MTLEEREREREREGERERERTRRFADSGYLATRRRVYICPAANQNN